MNFIAWFKKSLEDQNGEASFKRITNYVLLSLVCFMVIYPVVRKELNVYYIYILIILVVTMLINTGVVTWENLTKMASIVRTGKNDLPDPQAYIGQVKSEIQLTPKTTD